jgi:hypothetical protein
MKNWGITRNEVIALTDCPNRPDGLHNFTSRVTRRRARDLFRKTTWFVCFKCNRTWKEYKP